MAAREEDLDLIRRWFRKFQVAIQTVDFAGSRSLFAEDIITFGSFTAFTMGREATEHEQWRHVLGHIDQFRWRLGDLRKILLQVCASAHISRLKRSEALLGRKITLLCGRGGAMVAAVLRGESTMPHSSAAQEPFAPLAQAACYPDDLLDEIQTALAALADVEVRYEIDRKHIVAWTGLGSFQKRFAAQLEERHQRDREPYVQRLSDLQHRIIASMALHDIGSTA